MSLAQQLEAVRGYRRAPERQLRVLQRGFDLGTRGKTTWTRESVHERASRRPGAQELFVTLTRKAR